MNKCLGCGITLQNTNHEEKGYTKNLDNRYCERCFKTIHYNQYIKINNMDNTKIINKINKLNLFTFFITDFLSINKELIDTFKKITNNKILVINKCDMIPNNIILEHIEENIKKVYDINNEVIFISAKYNKYLNYIEKLIEYYKSVIFCGETSSGKSTLINNLISSKLTTSKYQNTTLDFIKLRKDNYIIYDTPGLILKNNNINENNKINVYTKKLSNDYVLNINNVKIKGNGYITIYLNKEDKIISKKEDTKLDIIKNINKPTDIIIPNGFIYTNNCVILTDTLLEERDSIIK